MENKNISRLDNKFRNQLSNLHINSRIIELGGVQTLQGFSQDYGFGFWIQPTDEDNKIVLISLWPEMYREHGEPDTRITIRQNDLDEVIIRLCSELERVAKEKQSEGGRMYKPVVGNTGMNKTLPKLKRIESSYPTMMLDGLPISTNTNP